MEGQLCRCLLTCVAWLAESPIERGWCLTGGIRLGWPENGKTKAQQTIKIIIAGVWGPVLVLVYLPLLLSKHLVEAWGKSLVEMNACNLNLMLFSVGVFVHSKQVFSNLSTFLNMTALYTYLDLILCIQRTYIHGGFRKKSLSNLRRGVFGMSGCLFKCLTRNFELVEGMRSLAKHPWAVHRHLALFCASDKSCRRKCLKAEMRLRK